jgi:hypothetical protein
MATMEADYEFFVLPSYKPCQFDGIHCGLGTNEDPCWGEVTYYDTTDEGDVLHTCEGHSYCVVVNYRPSDRAEDIGVAPSKMIQGR